MASDLQENPDGDPVAAVVLPVYGPDGTCLTDFGPDPVAAAGRAPRTGEQRQVEAIAACPPGPELDAWLRGLNLKVLSPKIVVEIVAARARMAAYQHAAMLDATAELARREEMRPDWSPLAGAPPTVRCVAGDELAMRLGWSRMSAVKLVHQAVFLDGMLAATREALETGRIDAAKCAVIVEGVQDLAFEGAQAVEDEVLPDAHQCSKAQLEQRVQRAVRLVDPEGEAARHDRARRTRRVGHPRSRPHGMASMWLLLAAEDATRVDGVLDHAARAAKALGDGRTLDELRADGLRDLVVGDVPASDGPACEVRLDPPAPVVPKPRRSAEHLTTTRFSLVPHPPVDPVPTGTLVPLDATTLEPAAGAAPTPLPAPDAPPGLGVPGVPAAAHPDTAAPAATTASTAPSPDAAPTAPGTETIASVAAPAGTALATARRGCTHCAGRPGAEVRVTINASTLLGLDDQPADLDGHGPIDAVRARALAAGGVWRRLVTDPVTRRLLDVGRERYRPPVALDEFVRTRDGTCSAPGCTVPACRCELDHTEEFHPRPGDPGDRDVPLGRTDADNLGPVCHRHHRLKTDGGFRLRQIEPGLFEWITPTGHRYLTRPGTGQSHDATTDPYDAPPPF
ncbi:HNH endonuclease signature motif containing protein [Cellulomonas sp. GbtcB1]|uniref:HNH endonuclease signature motif containing protein n=1 Tax=Cellulomonas sp. GbtcB1 TaxID=2824746 RepID=UPI001C2F42BB|nr:HNH endonuclease signature motif containing protein [Cellulomonas sp. GbtcB1]